MSGSNRRIAYCTNVHAGADLTQTRANLDRFAVDVKRRFSPEAPMGVGLWLSASSAASLLQDSALDEFAEWLGGNGLRPFTMNGFPFGDFHQEVVKHDVYLPTWFDRRRLDYTRNLVAIQHRLLGDGEEGSISTLPIAWGNPRPGAAELEQAADNLREAALELSRLEKESGRLIYLCIEPEPGCYVQRSEDMVEFFERFLFRRHEEAVRRHIRVCHDICHAAVMFEPQREVIERIRRAGIEIGKVQVSSAIHVPFAEIEPASRVAAFDELGSFAEDRYLHQTVRRRADGRTEFYEDLPLALDKLGSPSDIEDELRVHFHVPIYLASFGHLQTSRPQILDCLDAVAELSEARHFEVETYAWSVLPQELRETDLAVAIAAEMHWLADACASVGS